jgi:uncharacterized protein (DUF2235 family)
LEAQVRNIVVCCDGPASETGKSLSNVHKLFFCLSKTTTFQVAFYEPGIGARAPGSSPKAWQSAQALFVLATGYGLDDSILNSYEFLVKNYEEGDEIYLFGFSLGAYTARMLAGLIHKVGLLRPEQMNLLGPSLTAYKQYSERDGTERIGPDILQLPGYEDGERSIASRSDQAAQFARIVSSRLPTIRFLGVWDTVASIMIPRPDRFYIPTTLETAYTHYNPSVRTFRQAASIDERRRMYRLRCWRTGQTFLHQRLDAASADTQDSLQVWFAGVHGDIGGGYPEAESGLSKYPLIWMIEEAMKCGLKINLKTFRQVAWGETEEGVPFHYASPSVCGKLHNPMTTGWRIFEYFPKAAKHKEWPTRKRFCGLYVPDAEPRLIPEGASIHESTLKRMDALSNYRPDNLPNAFETVPMR